MILDCHLCGEDVERQKKVKNPICFKCKAKRVTEYSKIRNRYYDTARIDKLRQIRVEVEKNFSRKKVYGKECKECKIPMYNVHFTKEFCNGTCQRKYKKNENTNKIKRLPIRMY